MESRFYKKVLLLLAGAFFFSAFSQAYASPFEDKIVANNKNLAFSTKPVEVEKYTKDLKHALVKEYNFYKKQDNYKEATEALYGVLNLTKKDSFWYSFYQKRLDKALTKADINLQDSDYLLETAWNLNNKGRMNSAKYLLDIYKKTQDLNWKYYEILGDNLFLTCDFKGANEAYLKSLDLRENNKYLNLKLATSYEKMGQGNLAVEVYRKILSNNDEEIAQEIIKLFEAKLNADNENQNYYEILGSAWLVLGDNQKTEEYYNKALEIKPDDIFLRYLFAGYLHQIGENEKAIEVYDSILNYDIYELQIRAGKAKCLKKLGKEKEAIKEYQAILLFYPNSPQAKFGIYEILNGKKSDLEILKAFYPLNKNFEPSSEFIVEFADNILLLNDRKGAERFYSLAYSKNNKSKQVLVSLYNYYELINNQEMAKNIADEAYKLFPNDSKIVDIYANIHKTLIEKKNALALEYISKKQYKLAIETYEQIIPKDDRIYFAIANCYNMLDDTKSAIEYFEKAISFNPKNFDAYYSLAILNFKKDDLKLAEAMLKKALTISPENKNASVLLKTIVQKQVDKILNIAYQYHERKDYKSADSTLAEGLKNYPKESQLYYYKGLNKEASGDILGAIQEYRFAVKVDKNCSIAYYSLGILLEKVDNKKAALEAFETYLSHNTDDTNRNKYAKERVEVLSKECY